RDRLRRARLCAVRAPGAVRAGQCHAGRAVASRMRLRRILLTLLVLVLVAGAAYTGYVGYEGSRQLVEASTDAGDCRTPDMQFGRTYEAINYDIATSAAPT